MDSTNKILFSEDDISIKPFLRFLGIRYLTWGEKVYCSMQNIIEQEKKYGDFEETLRHESAHIEQFRMLGKTWFVIIYVVSTILHLGKHRKNRLEKYAITEAAKFCK